MLERVETIKPRDLANNLIKDGLRVLPVLEGFPPRRKQIALSAFLRPTFRDSKTKLELPDIQETMIKIVKENEDININHLKFLVQPLLNVTQISFSLGDVEVIEFAIEMTKDLIDTSKRPKDIKDIGVLRRLVEKIKKL